MGAQDTIFYRLVMWNRILKYVFWVYFWFFEAEIDFNRLTSNNYKPLDKNFLVLIIESKIHE